MMFDADVLRQQIPYYLTAPPDQRKFLKELKSLGDGAKSGYFISPQSDPYLDEMLQGDGWRNFQIFLFEAMRQRSVRGIVLSNTCDISPENKRDLPPKVIFAPIVKLSQIQKRFVENNLPEEKIASKTEAIRSQKTTNIFYLPADGPLDDEYVALLDDLHSMPVKTHQQQTKKLFTLSMAGFYLFIFKLSIHFCRLHESVNRNLSITVNGPR